MNVTQPGDYYRTQARNGPWWQGFKVIDVLDKEYVIIECDDEGREIPDAKLRYVQKHVFIERFQKVEKVNGVFHPAHAGI